MSDKTFADFGIEVPYGRTGEVDTTCPQCSPARKKSRDRCLSVNVEAGTWYCHHCQWSGGLGAGEDGSPVYGAPLPKRQYTVPESPADAGETLPPAVAAWFARRGIADWVIAEAGISAGSEWCPQLEQRVMAIRFPYLREGKLVNIKYRAHPKHFWMVRGAERILYGIDGLADAETICVVEGEMDKLTIDTAGGWPTVSVPDGAPSPDATNYAAKFSFLESAQAYFETAKVIVLATDMDAPGQKLADELARRFGPAKCRRVIWPNGCKDANETLVAHGPDAVCAALADAQPYPVAGIVTPRDLAGALDVLYEVGYDRGVTAGWPTFDRHYRARVGLMTIVTGSPGSGKSVFLDNLMVRLAERHGWSFGICSPENQPLERHLAGILAVRVGRPFADGPTPRMTKAELAEARAWAESRFAFVLPSEPTVDAIIERARVLVYRMGISGLVIDPWNELDHSRPDRLSETEYVSRVLSRLRGFARECRVHVWLVAHPTKLQKDKQGEYPVPTPYDISGSAHFFNKADACISFWRDKLNPSVPVEMHVQKIRFAETGELGVVPFGYDKPTGRFYEV